MPDPSVTNHVYDAHLPLWKTMRDTANGEPAVKAGGEDYLRRLGGHNAKEYEDYLSRASFYNATGRTIDGLSGMVFRKPPQVEVPDGMSDFMEDVTLGGLDFQGFSEGVVDENLKVGRLGILVDFPRVEVGGITRAQAERMNLRPFFSLYKAESILPPKVGQVGNKTVLMQVRLKETVKEPTDQFGEEEIEQIRVLELTDSDGGVIYRQQIWREVEVKDTQGRPTKEWQQVGDDIIPQMGGKPLDFIPFVFIGPKDTTPEVDKPPLLDLALKNLDHYRMDADYHHSLHFLAAGMTPWGKGVEKEEIDNGVFSATGPTNIWLSESDSAEFGVLEFTGAGIGAQRQALEDAKAEMAALGAKMLAPEKRQAEAAETAAIHRQGEISVLSSLAQATSIGLTRALEVARDWMGLGGDVSAELNRDYLPSKMTPDEMRAYFEAMQGGALSYESYIKALVAGERLDPDTDHEEEQQRILNDEFAGVEGANVGQV